MPHECTTCGRTFADGSKEMLSGCPDCGGNKFQYHPRTASEGPPDDSLSAEDSMSSADPMSSDDSISVEDAAPLEDTARVEDSDPIEGTIDSSFEFGPSAGSPLGDESQVTDETPPANDARPGEDRAQASARSTIVSEEELALSNPDDASVSRPQTSNAGDSTPDQDHSETPEDGASPSPGLSELREELNEQFESIKIHDRGEYELNLMELYDREEHIVALQEDGRYVIDVPSSWREGDESG